MPKANGVSTIQDQSQNMAVWADKFIATLRQTIARDGLRWHPPTVSQDENDNSVEISWWRADKSLIVTIEPNGPSTYLKVWGPNIHSEMEGGDLPTDDQLIALWQWLYA